MRQNGAELLFQVLTDRDEKSALAIAFKEAFSALDANTDLRISAIVDRLTFNGQVIETDTTSNSLEHSRAARTGT